LFRRANDQFCAISPRWWLPALALYSVRVGFSRNSGISVVGFYVDHIGWQWMFWQDIIIGPLLACSFISERRREGEF